MSEVVRAGAAGWRERVLLVFVESDAPVVERFVSERLGDLGFQVHLARSGDGGPSVELDFPTALFVPVALTGEVSSLTAPSELRRLPIVDLRKWKALVFMGVVVPEGDSDIFRLALDDGGDWTIRLAEALRRMTSH